MSEKKKVTSNLDEAERAAISRLVESDSLAMYESAEDEEGTEYSALDATMNILDDLWDPFNWTAMEWENSRDSREEVIKKQAREISLARVLDQEQLATVSETWTNLVKSLPATKEERRQLGVQCVQKLEQLRQEMASKGFLSPEQIELNKDNQVLLSLLMYDRMVPSSLVVKAEELNLDPALFASLSTALGLTMVLNRDCIQPEYLVEVLNKDAESTTKRWEDELEEALIGIMKPTYPDDWGYAFSEKYKAEVKAEVEQEMNQVQQLFAQVRAGSAEFYSLQIHEMRGRFSPRDLSEITISYFDQQKHLKSLTIKKSITSVTLSEVEKVIPFFKHHWANTSELTHDDLTLQPQLKQYSLRYDYYEQRDLASGTEKETIVPVSAFSYTQRHSLERQLAVTKELEREKAALPALVAEEVAQAQPTTFILAENMTTKTVDFRGKISTFAFKIDRSHVTLEAKLELRPTVLATSQNQPSFRLPLVAELQKVPGEDLLSNIREAHLDLYRYMVEDVTPKEMNELYIVYRLADNNVVLSLVDPVPQGEEGKIYQASITTQESITGNRVDLELLHGFLEKAKDPVSVKRVADLYTTIIADSDQLSADIKKTLIMTIVDYVRSQFGVVLLDRTVMAVHQKSVPRQEDVSNQDEAVKKKKQQQVGETERDVQLADWQKFLAYVTGKVGGYSEKKVHDAETLDFSTEAETELILLFNRYRNEPNALKEAMQEKILALVLEKETSSSRKKINERLYGSFLGKKVSWKIDDALQSTIGRGWRSLSKSSFLQTQRLIYAEQHLNRLVAMAERYWENLEHAEKMQEDEKKKRLETNDGESNFNSQDLDEQIRAIQIQDNGESSK